MGTMAANGVRKVGDVVIDNFKGKSPEEREVLKAQYGATVNKTRDIGIEQGYAARRSLTGAKVSLTTGPDTVILEIGNWLRLYDMVVDSVSITYSEQMTAMGPIYADVDLQLSSLETMAFNEDGTISQMELTSNLNQKSKVSFVQESTTKYQGQ